MSAFPGLGRSEHPTERAIVEVVHEDGTCDCRVPGRPHPYTRLASCSGKFRPHVGQTVEVAFIDYHRTGRRWLPFILGPSSACMGSGISSGGGPMVLAWHNGVAGTPNYTGSRYVLDTGYRPWKMDAGWSIPGPWNAIIGYTVDQGYILTVLGQQVRCYRANNGALVWSYDLPAEDAKPLYNPARREVVFLRAGSPYVTPIQTHVDVILDAVTGTVVGGHTAWQRTSNLPLNGVVVWSDWIYDLRPRGDSLDPYTDPRRFRRSGDGGYTPEGTLAMAQPSIPWASSVRDWYGGLATPAGQAPYAMFGSGPVGSGFRYWGSVGMLDLDAGTSSITDVLHGPPPTTGESSGAHGFTVDTISPDGTCVGRMQNGPTVHDNCVYEVMWDANGTRLATHREPNWPMLTWDTPRTLFPPSAGRRIVADDNNTHQQSVVRDLSETLWTLPDGAYVTGHGGETSSGEDAWILTMGDEGYMFRDFDSGAVLGAWAGAWPVMVSAGVIYDTGGAGNLRRWMA